MDTIDSEQNQRAEERAITAFLVREAERRVRGRRSHAEVLASIDDRPRRPWSSLAVPTLVMVLMLGVAAVALSIGATSNDGIQHVLSTAPGPTTLPVVAPGQPCPISTAHESATGVSMFGDGPVRLMIPTSAGTVFFETTPGGDWKAIETQWVGESTGSGIATVKGARLDGSGDLGFGDAADPVRELTLKLDAAAERIGGRLVLDLSPIRVRSAGCYGLEIVAAGQTSVVVFEARPMVDAFARMERPLQLPTATHDACPTSTVTSGVPFSPRALGEGSVYLLGESVLSLSGARQSGGYWFVSSNWAAAPSEPGPILVRGVRVDAGGDLRFGDGADPAESLDLPILSQDHTPGQPPGWRIFNTYLRPRSSGCYAVQVDTLTESQVLVIDVTP